MDSQKNTNSQVLFIHSAGAQGAGEGSDGLLKYMQNRLEPEYTLLHPLMPDPEQPQYASWKEKLDEVFAQLNDGVILVGHSLGGSVLLKYLSEAETSVDIAGLCLIAAPYWGADGDWNVDEFTLQQDFAAKLPHIPHIFLYQSRDDTVVPLSHLQHYANALPQAELIKLDSGGHEFSDGLPQLVQDVRDL